IFIDGSCTDTAPDRDSPSITQLEVISEINKRGACRRTAADALVAARNNRRAEGNTGAVRVRGPDRAGIMFVKAQFDFDAHAGFELVAAVQNANRIVLIPDLEILAAEWGRGRLHMYGLKMIISGTKAEIPTRILGQGRSVERGKSHARKGNRT